MNSKRICTRLVTCVLTMAICIVGGGVVNGVAILDRTDVAVSAINRNDTVESPRYLLGGFTLECATVTPGGGALSDGSILATGQVAVGRISNASFTIDVGVIPCLQSARMVNGDADGDADHDLADYDAMEDCLEGADGDLPSAQCEVFDFDEDGDVDLDDFEEFQNIFDE